MEQLPPSQLPRSTRLVAGVLRWSAIGLAFLLFLEVVSRFTFGSIAWRVASIPSVLSPACGASFSLAARRMETSLHWDPSVPPRRILNEYAFYLRSSDGDACVFLVHPLRPVGLWSGLDWGPIVVTLSKSTGEERVERAKGWVGI